MRLYCLGLFVFATISLLGQKNSVKDEYLGKISLAVLSTTNPDNLTISQLAKIQSKVYSLITSYGISGTGANTNFGVKPAVHVYSIDVAEGIRNVFVAQIDFSLTIVQGSNGLVFSSYTKTIKGTGKNKEDAITNAIGQLKSDSDVGQFIENGKTKILAFYNSKCSDIILEADRLSGIGEYQHALAVLMCIPIEATPCYEKVKNKSIEIFKLYQKKECLSQMQIAKSQIVQKNYTSALNTLAFIDPTSSCFQASQEMMNSIEAKLTAEEKRQWDMEKERMKNSAEMEKLQIEAMRDVAVSFLSIFGGGELDIIGTILGFLL